MTASPQPRLANPVSSLNREPWSETARIVVTEQPRVNPNLPFCIDAPGSLPRPLHSIIKRSGIRLKKLYSIRDGRNNCTEGQHGQGKSTGRKDSPGDSFEPRTAWRREPAARDRR